MKKFKITAAISAFIFLISACSALQQNNTKTVTGTLALGHEVRSFTDDADGKEYWVVDKSGELMKMYKNVIGSDIINSQPTKAKLKVKQLPILEDGFGAEYDGTYQVIEIISVINTKN